MSSKLLSLYARPDDKGLALLKNAMNRLNLSARAYDRILKVARTIADLENSDLIQPSHLAEAIGYRNLDRRLGRIIRKNNSSLFSPNLHHFLPNYNFIGLDLQ